jgi:hypothetical protein
MSLADHKDQREPGGVGLRNDMRVSAATGFSAFGKNSEFSKPVGECLLGLGKDEELEKLFGGLKHTKPARSVGGDRPRAAPFQGVPSLAALKSAIFARLPEVWGHAGYILLRQRLFDISCEEGFVSKDDVVLLMREELGLTQDQVSDAALQAYLGNLITMRKQELHVSALMSSLRPALTPEAKRRVLQLFQALKPEAGVVRLGAWLDVLKDDELRNIVVTAFGADDRSQVTDMPVSEQVFMELMSDLLPLGDSELLLPAELCR